MSKTLKGNKCQRVLYWETPENDTHLQSHHILHNRSFRSLQDSQSHLLEQDTIQVLEMELAERVALDTRKLQSLKKKLQ